MEQLILKYLQRNLSKAEEHELKQWLHEDIQNRKVFENIVGDWKISQDDLDQAKGRVLTKIKFQKKVDTPGRQLNKWKYAAVAAILVLGAGLVFFFQGFTSEEEMVAETVKMTTKETANGQKLTFKLPDGSIVKLNAGSKLMYPESFAQGVREVALIGEAFFDIERDVNRPFIISSDNIHVKVLGTSFNVRSYPEDEEVRVAVKTGKVSVESQMTGDRVILTPNEHASYHASKHLLEKQPIVNQEMIYGWMDNQLVFDDLNLEELLSSLSRWYGIEFAIAGNIDQTEKFTGTYNNPTLNEVLSSLSFAYDFNYQINEKRVIIK